MKAKINLKKIFYLLNFKKIQFCKKIYCMKSWKTGIIYKPLKWEISKLIYNKKLVKSL